MAAPFPAAVEDAKALICDLCASLYKMGWVGGTGGGISIKPTPEHIVMAPSGVQKERMQPDDMFVLDAAGTVLHTPAAKPPPARPPKLSECSPLFMAAYELRGAGAVIHGHSVNALLATLLDPDATEFKVTHIEMIKGIEGHGFYGNCVVPIIENTARECELTDRLRQAIAEYPQSQAVLVRRHGVYVWGKDWIQAKTQAECYDYLFQAAVEMRKLGMDASKPPAPPPLPAPAALPTSNGHAHDGSTPAPKKARMAPHGAATRSLPTAVVLDIEGTVAPISFVKEVMFPYAQAHTRAFLEASYESSETQEDIQLIRQQGQEAVIKAVVAWVEAAIGADRKVGALKQLQGHVWRSGFQQGKMRAELYRDVPDALVEWRSLGLKTYIYSSGSREAQRMFFAHSQAGDMRPYLSGFFDTTSGAKTLPASYKDIALRASSSSAWSKDHIAVQEPRRGPELGDVQCNRPGVPDKCPGMCSGGGSSGSGGVGPGILIINAGTAIATGGTGTGGAGGRGGFGRRGLLGNGGAGGAGIGGSSSVVGSGTSIGGQ
ncbi:2,3-diketo-5-methylthio-1-phosphopentane phosphatase, partial [Haematococcus lacustris]